MASAGTFTLAGALLDVRGGCDTSLNRAEAQRGVWNAGPEPSLGWCRPQ